MHRQLDRTRLELAAHRLLEKMAEDASFRKHLVFISIPVLNGTFSILQARIHQCIIVKVTGALIIIETPYVNNAVTTTGALMTIIP